MFQDKLYYMMNKPAGCITARSDASHRTVMEYFPEELAGELFPVGRLDKDTQGLLFFTNDGSFDQRIMHPKHHAPKRYYLFATGSLSDEAIERIEEGQTLSGEESRPGVRPSQSPNAEDMRNLKNGSHRKNVSGIMNLTETDLYLPRSLRFMRGRSTR